MLVTPYFKGEIHVLSSSMIISNLKFKIFFKIIGVIASVASSI